MLAFIENFQLSEGIIIVIVAVLIFGRRLPQVAGQAAAHIGRARRALNELWRESGLEEEMRKVQREVDLSRSSFPTVLRSSGAQPKRPRLPAPSTADADAEPAVRPPGSEPPTAPSAGDRGPTASQPDDAPGER